MVQIPTRTRTRTLSFSVREAGCPPRTRPLDPHARGEEPDAKRARQSYAPIRVPRTATPLAPKSVNLTVTAVPFPTDDSCSDDAQWGTSALPAASTSTSTSTSTPTSSAPRPKRLVARTVSSAAAPSKPKPKPTPTPAPCTTTPLQAARARRPSPLAPYWKPSEFPMTRPRRGRLPPEPLARKALKAHFAQTPHGAAVVKLGARRAIAQAECVEALERVRRLSGEKSTGSGIAANRRGAVGSVGCPGGVSRAQLLPPVVMVERSGPIPRSGFVRFPTSPTRLDTLTDDGWVPLSVQPAPMEVEVEECDIVEMETDGWSRL